VERNKIGASKFIEKTVYATDDYGDPEFLNFMVDKAAARGDAKNVSGFLELVHGAKKSGLTDAIPHFMLGNGELGGKALQKAGMKLEGVPKLIDEEKGIWEFKVDGKTIKRNMKQIAGLANPETYFKELGKASKTQSEIKENEAQAEAATEKGKKYKSEAGLKDEQTKRLKEGKTISGASGSGSKDSKPTSIKEVEWYESPDRTEEEKAAFDKLKKTGADERKFREGLIKAGVTAGKSPTRAKAEVDEMLGTGETADQSPKKKVKRYNPDTGRIE